MSHFLWKFPCFLSNSIIPHNFLPNSINLFFKISYFTHLMPIRARNYCNVHVLVPQKFTNQPVGRSPRTQTALTSPNQLTATSRRCKHAQNKRTNLYAPRKWNNIFLHFFRTNARYLIMIKAQWRVFRMSNGLSQVHNAVRWCGVQRKLEFPSCWRWQRARMWWGNGRGVDVAHYFCHYCAALNEMGVTWTGNIVRFCWGVWHILNRFPLVDKYLYRNFNHRCKWQTYYWTVSSFHRARSLIETFRMVACGIEFNLDTPCVGSGSTLMSRSFTL